MIVEPIELVATSTGNVGRCATGCGRPATFMVTARTRGHACSTFTCGPHRLDAEVKALRTLADSLEVHLVELRRSQSSRTVGARP